MPLPWKESLLIGCIGAGWVFVTSTVLIWLFPIWLVLTAIVAWSIGTRLHPFPPGAVAAALGPSAVTAAVLFILGGEGVEYGFAMAQVAGIHVAVAFLSGFVGGHSSASRSR